MNLRSLALASVGFAALGFGALGCGSGHPRADADADGAGDVGAGDADEAGDGGGGADADTAEAIPKAPPAAWAGSRLVVPGPATLVGRGQDSCTNAPAPVGDRWCAFARPAGESTELWVIDVTKAAAGAVIICDGADASCFRLTSRLHKSRENGVGDSGFNGDTLIYGEDRFPGLGSGFFTGVLWAWRPGWTAGRALTSDLGLYCVGQARSDAALCFENRIGDAMVQDVTVDLHAGNVSSVDASGLPKLDTLLVAATTDAPGAPVQSQFDLSPDGAYVAWSTRTATDPVETLHAYRLGAKSEPLVVAKDVSHWAISPDGAAWYWLAGYNHDVAGAPAGTLQAASFPDGTAATTLATAVGDYAPMGAASLWLRADVVAQVGTLRWMADRLAPTAATTVDTKVLAVLDHGPDGSRFLYAKTFTPVRPEPYTTNPAFDLVDLYIGAAGGAPCAVAETPEAVHATIFPAGDVVVWDRYDATTGEVRGFATTVSSCTSAPFAKRLANLLPAGDAGYLYLDDADKEANEATLRYAGIVNGALVAGTQPIQTRARPVFAPLQPALAAVAYTVQADSPADGLYVSAVPAPDASPPTSPGDGGGGS
jgi:hypothetical protein